MGDSDKDYFYKEETKVAQEKTNDSTSTKKKSEPELSISDLLHLMDIYEREWEYRNSRFVHQLYSMYYIALIIIVFPKITNYAKINLPKMPSILFPIIGLGFSIFSLIMAQSFRLRTDASGQTYKKMMQLLPEKYRRLSIDNVSQKRKSKHSLFNWSQQKILSWTLFIMELLVSLIMIWDLL